MIARPRTRALPLALIGLILLAGCSTGQSGDPTRESPATATVSQAGVDPTPSLAPTDVPPTVTPTATPPPSPAATAARTPTPASTPTQAPVPTPAPPTPTPRPALPQTAHLDPMTHAFQTWNNCSAVSASMVLSYFGISKSQADLATVFRPNLNDKHVEPKQLVRFFPDYGLSVKLVEGGSVERVKELLAAGIPVIAPQWLDFKPDAIGHYRVIRGYDDARGGFLVNDSMIGADVFYSYADFTALWRAFNYRYLPIYRPEQEQQVLAILGADADREANLERARQLFTQLTQEQPDDAYLAFSLGSSYFELGDYQRAVEQYERAAAIGLPPKMLWYQFWPAAAYNEVGNYQRAFELATEQIASAGTFGEMRYERGRAYEGMGKPDLARQEYWQALRDDANLTNARNALARLGG